MSDPKSDKQPAPRLPSLPGFGRRDLSASASAPVAVVPIAASSGASGAASRSRSSFAPNLSAAGKRSTAAPAADSDKRSDRREPRQKKERKPDDKFKKEKREVIQTKSIFSEGIQAVKAKKELQSAGSSTSVIGSTSQLPGFKPKTSFLDSLSAPKESRGRFNDDDDDTKFTPGAVKREVVHAGGALESDEDALKRLMKSSFIADVKDPDKKFVDLPLCKVEIPDKSMKMEVDDDVKPLISKDEGNIAFIQLPSILSELLLANSNKQEDGNNEDVKPQVEQMHTLDALPEGLVGKLQVLRSGRIRLKIGNLTMNVDSGSDAGCLQELVCMDQSKMCVLGRVKERLVATPDFSAYS